MKEKENQKFYSSQFSSILTVEDHLYDCGFGSWFKEAVNFSNSNRKLSSLALSTDVINMVSTEEEILKTLNYFQLTMKNYKKVCMILEDVSKEPIYFRQILKVLGYLEIISFYMIKI